MYVDIGDHIALQYGGSEAHKKVSSERSESIAGPIGKVSLYFAVVYVQQSLKRSLKNLVINRFSTKNSSLQSEDTTATPSQTD
jgi:hypothetical protein